MQQTFGTALMNPNKTSYEDSKVLAKIIAKILTKTSVQDFHQDFFYQDSYYNILPRLFARCSPRFLLKRLPKIFQPIFLPIRLIQILFKISKLLNPGHYSQMTRQGCKSGVFQEMWTWAQCCQPLLQIMTRPQLRNI